MNKYPDIKSYREANGLSQEKMAELISSYGKPCGQSRISQWENGQLGFTPKWATQVEIATGGELSRVCLIFGPNVKAA